MRVTDWTVPAPTMGSSWSGYSTWVRHDVGSTFVQLFDVALGIWMGLPAGLCLFQETCGDGVALEQWRRVFLRPLCLSEYRIGNLLETSLGDMVRGRVNGRLAPPEETLPAVLPSL